MTRGELNDPRRNAGAVGRLATRLSLVGFHALGDNEPGLCASRKEVADRPHPGDIVKCSCADRPRQRRPGSPRPWIAEDPCAAIGTHAPLLDATAQGNAAEHRPRFAAGHAERLVGNQHGNGERASSSHLAIPAVADVSRGRGH